MSEKEKNENINSMATVSQKYGSTLRTIQQVRDDVCKSFKYSPKVVPLIIGEAGVGKTVIIRSIAKELGKECIIVKLANLEKEDLTGFIHKSEDGNSYGFLPHKDIAARLQNPNTIIFFDEINRGDLPTVKAFFNVVDERKFGDFTLPEETILAAAMNPSTKNYNVYDILSEAALRKRFRVMCARVDAGTYINYIKSGHEEKGHPAVVEYLETHPTSVYNHRAMDLGQIFSSPHGWSRVSETIFNIEKDDENWVDNMDKYTPLIAGDINITEAEMFRAFVVDMNIAIKPNDVLFNYEKKAQKRLLKAIEMNKQGLIKETIESVCIQASSQEPDVKKIAKGFSKFLGDLATNLPDMAMALVTTFSNKCREKDPKIAYQKELNMELKTGDYPEFKEALKVIQKGLRAVENEGKDTAA
jgi:hypothetical protein